MNHPKYIKNKLSGCRTYGKVIGTTYHNEVSCGLKVQYHNSITFVHWSRYSSYMYMEVSEEEYLASLVLES